MDLLFHATYIASKVGKTGLTVTVDVDKILRSDGTRTAVATAASATEGRNGHYFYRVASVTDLVTYDYVACFKTSDGTVDTQHIHSGWMDFPTAYDTQLGYLTGDAYARLGAPSGASVSADLLTLLNRLIGTIATGTHSPQSGDAYARLGAPSGASVSADLLTLLNRLIGTIATGTHNPQSGDAFARLGAPSGASVSADLLTLLNRVVGTLLTGNHSPQSGDAYARLGAPSGASVSADISGKPTAAQIDTQLSGSHGAGSWLSAAGGSGAIDWHNSFIVTVDGSPRDGVFVRFTTDSAGVNVVATGTTNTFGKLDSLMLDAGTYYVWLQLAGVNFSNPYTEVVA